MGNWTQSVHHQTLYSRCPARVEHRYMKLLSQVVLEASLPWKMISTYFFFFHRDQSLSSPGRKKSLTPEKQNRTSHPLPKVNSDESRQASIGGERATGTRVAWEMGCCPTSSVIWEIVHTGVPDPCLALLNDLHHERAQGKVGQGSVTVDRSNRSEKATACTSLP